MKLGNSRLCDVESEKHRCEWCGTTDPFSSKGLCGTCSAITPSVYGLNPRQIPNVEDLTHYNQFLSPARELSDDDRILQLKSLISDDQIPNSFRPRKRVRWPDENAQMWRELREDLESGGRLPTGSFPLPTGSHIEFRTGERPRIVQQWRKRRVELRNPIPLIDIARQLEDSERVKSVRYWDKFIMALSECVRPLEEGEVPNGAWLRRNGWNGLDSPNICGNPFAGGYEPPVFHFLSMLFDEFDYHDEYSGSFVRRNLQAFEWLGEVGTEWLSAFEGSESRRGEMFSTDMHPRLVTVNNKLHILVLRGGEPTPIPVPQDPTLLTTLVTISLQPCFTFPSKVLDALFWNFDSELEGWTPIESEIKGAILLRSIVEGLGTRSSTVPIDIDGGEVLGLMVQGDHSLGLFYCIYPSRNYGKLNVTAALRPEDLRWRFDSQEICIDLHMPKYCVTADHAVSYLMGLANDSSSRNNIDTLDHLIDCASTVLPRVPEAASDQERWRYVKYCYQNRDLDTDFEQYQEMVRGVFSEQSEFAFLLEQDTDERIGEIL
mgnify:CR=1 FL=1